MPEFCWALPPKLSGRYDQAQVDQKSDGVVFSLSSTRSDLLAGRHAERVTSAMLWGKEAPEFSFQPTDLGIKGANQSDFPFRVGGEKGDQQTGLIKRENDKYINLFTWIRLFFFFFRAEKIDKVIYFTEACLGLCDIAC